MLKRRYGSREMLKRATLGIAQCASSRSSVGDDNRYQQDGALERSRRFEG